MKVSLVTLAICMNFAGATDPGYRLERITSLGAEELWSMMSPQRVSAGELIIEVRNYDDHAIPRKDREHACGVVTIGTDDIGSIPVAVRVWSRAPCELSAAFVKSDPSAPRVGRISVNAGASFDLAVDQAYVVTVGSETVGKIQ